MNYYCLDAEWNGDVADTIHVIVIKKYPDGVKQTFLNVDDFAHWVDTNNIDKWFIHNGLAADAPVINKVAGRTLLDTKKIVDTFVVSRLVDYMKFNTHGLKEIGEFLGVYKGDYTGGWDKRTTEMIKYCEQDVEVLEAIVEYFWEYIVDPSWAEAMRLEHEISVVCHDMHTNGFDFDFDKAVYLLGSVKDEMKKLEDNFKVTFPAQLKEVKRLKYRTKADGTPFKTVSDAMENYPKTEIEGDELVVYDWKEFNPGSPKERIDLLWDAGWEPTEKTKGHLLKIREERKWNY